ncbi:MAG: response regulator [Melioribacteraceae bacterium]|nr:response regulator [Melioribacteraceae bacterium]
MKEILLVDDEQEMLNSLKKLFNHKPEYKIRAINNPKEAINLVGSNKFDMIITDLKMGSYTGLDVLHNAFKKFPNTLGIVISGYGTIEASVEAIKEGAFDFIEKPFTSRKLFDTIEKAFSQSFNKDEKESALNEEALQGIIYKSDSMKGIIDLVKKLPTAI